MAVDTKNSEYHEYYEQWERCEDASEGQDEIHKEGIKYLPRLSGQNDAEYYAYKQRALYYNATARTIDGLSGMLFLKPEVRQQKPLIKVALKLKENQLRRHALW
jgi:hypothetical protein